MVVLVEQQQRVVWEVLATPVDLLVQMQLQ
jgi:hypothetical protein